MRLEVQVTDHNTALPKKVIGTVVREYDRPPRSGLITFGSNGKVKRQVSFKMYNQFHVFTFRKLVMQGVHSVYFYTQLI